MKNISKKIGILTLAFLVFSFPILNCCLLESVYADTAVEHSHHKDLAQTHQEDHHSHDSNSADTSSNEDCDWGTLAAALPNQTFIYFNSLTAKVFSFDVVSTSYDIASNLLLDSKRLSYLYSSQQSSRDSVPIYLQNSTLRI